MDKTSRNLLDEFSGQLQGFGIRDEFVPDWLGAMNTIAGSPEGESRQDHVTETPEHDAKDHRSYDLSVRHHSKRTFLGGESGRRPVKIARSITAAHHP